MEKGKSFSKVDLILYCSFCTFAAAMIHPSLKLGLGEIGELGPGLLPFVANLCVLATGAALAIKTLARKERVSPAAQIGEMDQRRWIRVFKILLSLAVWPLLVGVIGYIISTFLVVLGVAKAMEFRGWVQPIIFSTAVAFCIWFIFGLMFYVDLPAGFSF